MTYSFHKPVFEDIKWIKQKFAESQPQCCEFSAGNVLGWSKFYDGRIGDVEDCLTLRLYNDDSFCYPKGENSENAVISATITINGLSHLQTVIDRLQKIKGVISIDRS